MLPSLRIALCCHRPLVIALTLFLLAGLSYSRFADGSRKPYVAGLAAALALTAALYAASALMRHSSGHQLPPGDPDLARALAAAAVAVPSILLLEHGARVLHPTRWGVAYSPLYDDFATPAIAESRWRVEGEAAASVRQEGGTISVRPPAGKTACLQALLADTPSYPGPERVLPRGLVDAPSEEELSWSGAVTLEREYFVLLEWGTLLIQRTGYGLHVTYPGVDGHLRGDELSYAFSPAGAAHTWRVLHGPDGATLDVDGRQIWKGTQPQNLGYRPCFGEMRSDSAHGGHLTLDWVRFSRRLVPALRLGARLPLPF